MNKSLIQKIKRLKVTSLMELNEDERQYFLKAGKHVLKNYN
jgi:hypothetical protein